MSNLRNILNELAENIETDSSAYKGKTVDIAQKAIMSHFLRAFDEILTKSTNRVEYTKEVNSYIATIRANLENLS